MLVFYLNLRYLLNLFFIYYLILIFIIVVFECNILSFL
uniref:Uncharacterized protein n=1 Tax=Spyridia filamentosa TaxID=196632 RepID=A0A1Z1MK36_SPYFI|nr:hypothetical protein [Spyridia filamentosa]ARW66202.1 hypothetical protein [Spyridia filamentosa]